MGYHAETMGKILHSLHGRRERMIIYKFQICLKDRVRGFLGCIWESFKACWFEIHRYEEFLSNDGNPKLRICIEL